MVRSWLMAWLLALTLLGCQHDTSVTAKGSGTARVPVSTLLATVEAEQKAMEAIFMSGPIASRELGALNGKLQSRGYFRRVPSQPAIDALQSELRMLATAKALTVQALTIDTPPDLAAVQPFKLQLGERWQPKLEALRGVLQLRLDLQGSPRDLAAFIDALPTDCERLIVVTRREELPGGATLHAEAYYERPLPQPEVQLHWPSLDERLRAAGWSPDDRAVTGDPQYAALRTQVESGPQRLAEVRRILQISSDFPRWLLRWQFFEERGKAAMAVRGAALIGL